MVTTHYSAGENPVIPDPLAAIATKLTTLDELRDKVVALEVQSRDDKGKKVRHWADDTEDDMNLHRSRPLYGKIEFPKFIGG